MLVASIHTIGLLQGCQGGAKGDIQETSCSKQIQHLADNVFTSCHSNCNRYDYIIKDKSTFKNIVWEYVIIDEGHRVKNSNSKLFLTLKQYYKNKRKLLLTGILSAMLIDPSRNTTAEFTA